MSSEAPSASLRHQLPPGRDLENGKGEEDKGEEGQQAAANGAGHGGRLEAETRATFGGSFQEDAPAPYDAPPPLSRAASECRVRFDIFAAVARPCCRALRPQTVCLPSLALACLLAWEAEGTLAVMASCLSGTVHSVHLRDLRPGDLFAISRLRITTRDLEEALPPPHRSPVVRALRCGGHLGPWGDLPCSPA